MSTFFRTFVNFFWVFFSNFLYIYYRDLIEGGVLKTLEIVVVKKDGDKVNFDRDKIAKSVELALRKRPVDTDAKEKLISRIVNDVEGMGENEISSNVIGEAVMKALYTIDKVAYVRFASVYRDFRETKDFEQFLDTIDKK